MTYNNDDYDYYPPRRRRGDSGVLVAVATILGIVLLFAAVVIAGFFMFRYFAGDATSGSDHVQSTSTQQSNRATTSTTGPKELTPTHITSRGGDTAAPVTTVTVVETTRAASPARRTDWPEPFNGQGWVFNGHVEASCAPGETPYFLGRNDKNDAISVCERADGAMFYHSFVGGLSLNWGVDLNQSDLGGDLIVVTTDKARIEVRPTGCRVVQGEKIAADIPFTKSWQVR